MGEAKKRREAEERAKAAILDGLTGDALALAGTAISLFERFIFPQRYTGGCYLTSMFLNRYLREEKGISTEVIIGYVNDGTDDIMVSHAWIELDGLKTDLTLFLIEPYIAAPSGNVLVMDQVFRKGAVQHSYHRELNAAGAAMNRMLMSTPEYRELVLRKEREHLDMAALIQDPAAVAIHMANAPQGLRYEDMMRSIA